MPPPAGLTDALTQPGSATLLADILRCAYPRTTPTRGRHPHTNLNTAAHALNVSPTTIRRWLTTPTDRPALTPRHATHLAQLLAPTPTTLNREKITWNWNNEALARLRLGRGRGHMPHYDDTTYLQPHVLLILAINDTPLAKATITQLTHHTSIRARRGTTTIDFTTTPLPNRWSADQLRLNLLHHLHPWRIELPSPSRGHTQTWLATAPLPALADLVEPHDG